MKKHLLSILLIGGLVGAAASEDSEEIRLQQLYDYNPHLLPVHEALRLGSTSTSAANILLNGFGRAVAFSLHALSPSVVVTGFGYQYSPIIGTNLPNATIQTAVNTQTAYAMLCLARYNYLTGQPDLGFNPLARGVTGVPNTGYQGQVITNFNTNTFPLRLVIQPAILAANQKIIVVGYAYLITTSPGTNQYGVFVAKYNWDGSLDTSFNSTGTTPGVVVTPVSKLPAHPNLFSGIVDQGFAVALQADNKIVVTGSASGQLFVLRYNNALTVPATAGTLDATFNPDGFTYDFNKLKQPIVSAKNTTSPGIFICSILGRRTVSSTGLSLVGYDCGYAIAVQPDGKIVVAGTGASLIAPQSSTVFTTNLPTLTTNPTALGPNQLILLRLTTTGIPDPTFGQIVSGTVASGAQTTKIVGFDDRGYALAIQTDGKILVSGTSADVSLNYAMALVRYTTQGVVDTTFGGYQFGSSSVVAKGPYGPVNMKGKVRLYVLNTGDSNCPFTVANAMCLQPDGNIVLAGYNSYNMSANRFAMVVARFLPSGRLDLTFNPTGIPQGYSPAYNPVPSNFVIPLQKGVQTISIQGQYDQAYDVALQPPLPFPAPQTQKIVLVGSSWDTSAIKQLYAFAFARLLPNGLLDVSFGASFTNKGLASGLLDEESEHEEVRDAKYYFPVLTSE